MCASDDVNDKEPQNKQAKVGTRKAGHLMQAPVDGDGRCHFFVATKGRYCPFTTKLGNKLCGEHMVVCDSSAALPATRRVACPYDPSHSVDFSKLKKHMESLCNARLPKIRPAYVNTDCNVSMLPPGYAEKTFDECGKLWSDEALAKADARLMVQPGEQIYLGTTTSKVFGDLSSPSNEDLVRAKPELLNEVLVKRLLRPVVTAYLRSVSAAPENAESMDLEGLLEHVRPSEDYPMEICTHPVLEKRSHVKLNAKHLLQQSSLVGHLDKRGLLDSQYALVEFGAGKGELSVFVHAAMNQTQEDGSIFLVDRKNFRQKFVKDEDEPLRHHFERILIDIRDFDLAKIPKLQTTDPATGVTQLRPIVAYSKHLCGAATDLTIKCLERYRQAGGSVVGIAIALCCHQVCKYSMYVDHAYLSTAVANGSGTSEWCDRQRNEFRHLTTMSSWAINSPRDDLQHEEHCSGLSFSQRLRAGHAVKRFLDAGRLEFVRQKLGMDYAELVYYTARSTSPENLALFGGAITKQKTLCSQLSI
ncbi:tRNA:m4X modification enzyme [Coemansia aciculifera]|uniref:tRNA:m4X modification enzyme n=1 Tax=Coemansia aciculifera TaxID=417176 RepID=A0ACC1M131_9FUNG|nr:tRNA:m4X modification enzyme [Coemansia aciculifera]